MRQPEKEPKSYSTVQSHFRIRDRHYEARLVDCGKPNCTKCGGRGRRHPSHGPYWYLCYTHNARWYRQYLGKEVDTSRFVTHQGNLDIAALMAKRRNRRVQPAEKSHEAPGQLETLPPGAPGEIPVEAIPAYDPTYAATAPAPPNTPRVRICAPGDISMPAPDTPSPLEAGAVPAADADVDQAAPLLLPPPPSDPQDPGPVPGQVG